MHALPHGRSKVTLSEQQRSVSLELLRCAIGAARPLYAKEGDPHAPQAYERLFELLKAQTKTEHPWHVIQTIKGKQQIFSIIEELVPLRWKQAKQLIAPVCTKQIEALEEIRLPLALRQSCVDYLNKTLPDNNQLFLSTLQAWTENLFKEGYQYYRTAKSDLHALQEQGRISGHIIHPGFALTFTAAHLLHRLQELSGIEQDAHTRARTGYIQECYRYYSLVTEGIPHAVTAYQKALTSTPTKEATQDQERLYKQVLSKDSFPLKKLLNATADFSMADIGTSRATLSSLAPKLQRTLDLINRELKRGRTPIVTIEFEIVRDILKESIRAQIPDKELILVDASLPKAKRQSAWEALQTGKHSIVVASEIDAPEQIMHTLPVTVIAVTQHASPLTEYPLVKALRNGGIDVKIVTVIGAYSPDTARRKRAKTKPLSIRETCKLCNEALDLILDNDASIRTNAVEGFFESLNQILDRARKLKSRDNLQDAMIKSMSNRIHASYMEYGPDHPPYREITNAIKARYFQEVGIESSARRPLRSDFYGVLDGTIEDAKEALNTL
jgi:hypothetical protein